MNISPKIALIIFSASIQSLAFATEEQNGLSQKADEEKNLTTTNTAKKTTATLAACMEKLVLPLDHGPRAQSTPWLNQLRRQNFEKECATKQTQLSNTATQ